MRYVSTIICVRLWVACMLPLRHIREYFFKHRKKYLDKPTEGVKNGELLHSVVVEAVDPFQMTPTSMSNTYKVFHNHRMLWM
jgi:hypothetical protein